MLSNYLKFIGESSRCKSDSTPSFFYIVSTFHLYFTLISTQFINIQIISDINNNLTYLPIFYSLKIKWFQKSPF